MQVRHWGIFGLLLRIYGIHSSWVCKWWHLWILVYVQGIIYHLLKVLWRCKLCRIYLVWSSQRSKWVNFALISKGRSCFAQVVYSFLILALYVYNTRSKAWKCFQCFVLNRLRHILLFYNWIRYGDIRFLKVFLLCLLVILFFSVIII